MKVVECRGSAREMGRQYGEQAREEIREIVALYQSHGMCRPPAEFVTTARAVLTEYAPETLEEMDAIAEGAGVGAEAVLAMNQWDTFAGLRPSPGCTSMALRDGPDGPVLGKNNDGDAVSPPFVIRRSFPAAGLPMVQVTYAGWISGLDAMNAAGLVNSHNSVGSTFDRTGPRVDIRLSAYHAMRTCGTTAEFLAELARAPLTGKGFNIIAADASGDICVIEAAVPKLGIRGRGEPFVYATNHYVSAALKDADRRKPDAKDISRYRFGYLQWLAQSAPPADAKGVAKVLRSHEPWAPCRHGGPHQSHTLWSIIGLPRQACLRVASGPPCSNEFREFRPVA